MIYAAFRAWKTLRRYFISLPSKTAFYCVTKSREPTTNESDVFSVLACTLFVSVDDKLVSILPYHRKAKAFGCFSSVPEVTRTPDLPLRRRSLYPSELRKRTTPSIIISHRYHSDNYKFPSSGKLINPCSQILPLKRLPTAGSPYRSSLLMHSSNTRSLQLSVIR